MKVAGVKGIAGIPHIGSPGVNRAGFGSVWKHHYTRFPVMPAYLAPHAYRTEDRAIGVFLLFDRFIDRPSGDLEYWLVRSAAWARRSWVNNSDAVEQGVALKFYVEEALKQRITPLLKAYHVDVERDVIWFDGSKCVEYGGKHFNGRGGKQSVIFSDPQFRDYEWVFQIDADMFMARPPGCEEETYPFFSRFMTECKTDFAVVDLHGHRPIADMRWPVEKVDGRDDREAWCGLASELSKKSVRLDSVFRGNSAAMTAFRARRLHRHDLERLEWMTEAGRLLQSDEGMFSLAMFMGHKVAGMMTLLGIKGVWGVEQLYKVREQGEHYLAHMGLPHEWDWRADIGVEDV